ncbi:MAG TPA: selenocysteine-specific translation elongation factor [Actinomycetota bacterium]|nr:selenocysteine-specific translation elongation factor [Actinomycetota bacterium]
MHVIGTAGHVDHGKSTLVEKLTGIDPDRFAEEKARGLTIDLGFAWLSLPSGHEVGIIDVPGHERFIRNMLAGAGGVTICLFVVSAVEGWMPQSAEHLAIIDILGVSAGIVALTRADLVDEERLDSVRADLTARLAGTSLEGSAVVACAAPSGRGMDDLVAELDRLVAVTPPAPDLGRPRLWVDRVFTIAGAGTVVTGTLAGGWFRVGDTVEIAPEGRRARIRTIQRHNREVETIGPGNRVALNLAGLERAGAARGDAIVRPGDFRPTRRIDVQLRMLPPDLMGAGQPEGGQDRRGQGHVLRERGAHLLYAGAAETTVRIRLLDRDRVLPGETAFAQLTLADALPLQRGDRFVLRDAGRVLTFGGGRVIDPAPAPARRDDERVALLARLVDADAPAALEALVDAAGAIDRDDALFRSGAEDVPPTITDAGGVLLSRPEVARRQAAERARIESLGSEAVEVLARIEAAGLSPPMTKDLGSAGAVVRHLVASGDLVRIGDFHLTAAWAAEARRRVRAHIEENGPATVAEIRDLLGITRKHAVPLCEWLDATGATRREGDVRLLGPNP